jgi:cyclophilin family peptidyl-prolyl cis-trans isomerase
MAKNSKTSKPIKKTSPKAKTETSKIKKPIATVIESKPAVSEKQETSKIAVTKVASEILKDPSAQKQIIALVTGLIFIGLLALTVFVYIPHVLDNTDSAITARIKKETEAKTQADIEAKASLLAAENNTLKIDSTSNWKIAMDLKDFGVINLELKKDYAPATVENFVRLVSRKFYDGNRPHRIVLVDNFKVLQGGDPKGDGSGGETASGKPVPDEIWITAPTYAAEDAKNPASKQVLTNKPELRAPDLYKDFNPSTGQITYKKGLILMAKTSAPNSASSQYFITLDTTILPADYTVFGTVEESSFKVLDKILKEVKPIIADGGQPEMGGKPDPEIVTTTVKITSQS